MIAAEYYDDDQVPSLCNDTLNLGEILHFVQDDKDPHVRDSQKIKHPDDKMTR